MSYNKSIGQNTGGWPQHGHQPTRNNVWQQPSNYGNSSGNFTNFGGAGVRDMPPPQLPSVYGSSRPPQAMHQSPGPLSMSARMHMNYPMMPNTPVPMMPGHRQPVRYSLPLPEQSVARGDFNAPNLTPPQIDFSKSAFNNIRHPFSSFGSTQQPEQFAHADSSQRRPENTPEPSVDGKGQLQGTITDARFSEMANRAPPDDFWSTMMASKAGLINQPTVHQHQAAVSSSAVTTTCSVTKPITHIPSVSSDIGTKSMYSGTSSHHPQAAQTVKGEFANFSDIPQGLPPSVGLLPLQKMSDILNADEPPLTSNPADKDKPKRKRRKRCGKLTPSASLESAIYCDKR